MAQREGFDLFTRWGRRHWFKRGLFGDKDSRQYVLLDTIGHHICAILGHGRKTYPSEDGAICMRCYRVMGAKEADDEQG